MLRIRNRCFGNQNRVRIKLICAKCESSASINANNGIIFAYTDRIIERHIVSLTIRARIFRRKHRIRRRTVVVFPKSRIIVVKLNHISQPEAVLFSIGCTDDTHIITVCVLFACKKAPG